MIGQQIGRFRVLEKLGAGGMGEVYLALDPDLDRRIALKVLPESMAGSQERLLRFKREAKTLALLNHPNIVTIYSVESYDNIQFLTMEYVEGRTLTRSIPREGLGLQDFFGIAIPLTDALAAAHDKGVIHRDLKPGNVIVTKAGVVKVLDFGLAKQAPAETLEVDGERPTETLTGEGRVLGTVPYMSPEQLRGKPVDFRSDIFSLGIVLFQMATGERPFKGSTSAEVHSAILRDNPEPVDLVNVEFPHDVARVVRLCLEKDPDSRLQSARDVRNELSVLEEESSSEDVPPLSVPTDSVTEDDSVLGRSPKLGWYLLFSVLVVLAVLAIWNWAGSNGPTKPKLSVAAQALIDQAEVYETRGTTRENLEGAEYRYRQALELEPGSPTIQGKLASLLTELQINYPTAERPLEIGSLAEAALETDPDNVDARVALGYVAFQGGDLESAEQAGRTAIDVGPENPSGHSFLGEVLIEQGKIEPGLLELRQAVSLAGANVGPRLVLASALDDLGRLNEAAAEYERALKYSPDSPVALNNLGIIYGRQGRYLDAIPLLRRLLRIHEDPIAAYNLANCYFFLDRLPEAAENYQLALELDPEHIWAPHGLAETYEKLGDVDQAEIYFERALANYDDLLEVGGVDASTLGTRAVVAAKLGRYKEATEGIAEALSLSPEDGQVLFNAAQVYAMSGDRETAFRYIQQSIEAGYPRQEFEKDLSFAGYLGDPAFLALLETRGGP